ncbi:MAG: chorismate mutase [Spirochaetales bacterium]|nr:chorismate mutase [Spirochaetales bacterium]
MVRAVRGAVQVEADEKPLVAAGITKMITQIVDDNLIKVHDIVSIFFTVTGDIKSVNPAAALRTEDGWADTPLFCAQEPNTEGAMPRVVRVLVTCNNFKADQKVKHAYLGGAVSLRPDLK